MSNDSFAPAVFENQSFSVVPHKLLRCCFERKVSRNGIIALVLDCMCIQSDGRLHNYSRKDIMRIAGMNQGMADCASESLRRAGIIEPCTVLRNGIEVPDASHANHVGQDRIAPDIWASIPRR